MSKYLYNGVELPVLPDWDKTIHPYAFIAYNENWGLYLFTFKTGKYGVFSFGQAAFSGNCYGAVENGDAWTKRTEGDWYAFGGKIVWANYDVMYVTNDTTTANGVAGTLYLAASYPVNAETGEEIKDYAPTPILAPALDPLSLFMGWKAGNWVARQRGKA